MFKFFQQFLTDVYGWARYLLFSNSVLLLPLGLVRWMSTNGKELILELLWSNWKCFLRKCRNELPSLKTNKSLIQCCIPLFSFLTNFFIKFKWFRRLIFVENNLNIMDCEIFWKLCTYSEFKHSPDDTSRPELHPIQNFEIEQK